MKELFKETIFRMYMDADKEYLVFRTMHGGTEYIIYTADAQCCSDSWFESITNPEYLVGNEIIGIEEKIEREEIVPETDDMSQRILRIYGYTFKTSQGYSDIEFRNSSNGYYGGSCELVDNPELEVSFITGDQLQLSFGQNGKKVVLDRIQANPI